jgi:hypothetical protein
MNELLRLKLEILFPHKRQFGVDGPQKKFDILLGMMCGIESKESMNYVYDWVTTNEVFTSSERNGAIVEPINNLFNTIQFHQTPNTLLRMIEINPLALECFCDVIVYNMLSKAKTYNTDKDIMSNLRFWRMNGKPRIKSFYDLVFNTVTCKLSASRLERVVRQFNMENKLSK